MNISNKYLNVFTKHNLDSNGFSRIWLIGDILLDGSGKPVEAAGGIGKVDELKLAVVCLINRKDDNWLYTP